MCYSAQLLKAYGQYLKVFGANIDIEEFNRLYGFRLEDPSIKFPKAVEHEFNGAGTPLADSIQQHLDAYRAQQARKLETELFEQKTRLNDAERKLQTKVTKGATESRRIATNKIERAQEKLSGLNRTELTNQDHRFFPGSYVPVMFMEDGKKVVRPMRYQCRPAGKPAFYDTKYPGTYNARRDNLEGFWREQFGVTHGVIAITTFFEHVERVGADGQIEKTILQFDPRTHETMLLACLWSRWTAPGQPDLLSFAAITDEPPPEVAAAGHDRCVIPIKAEHLDDWLSPEQFSLQDMYAILDDKERPYYEHKLAA